MKITYDSTIKIAGIGLVPWTRLGPERWFPNYVIASLYGWDMAPQADRPKVMALSDTKKGIPELRRFNTQSLLKTTEFQELIFELPGYALLTYKPAKIPETLAERKFLMVNAELSQKFENKVVFRHMLSSLVPIPSFDVVERKTLGRDEESFAGVMAGRPSIVMQDEELSGGKGTFIVHDHKGYITALKALDTLSQHSRVVISDCIEHARERSIQCVITKDGVLTGPLQRQMVNHPLMVNTQVPQGDKFSGAQILATDQDTPVHRQATNYAQIIGLQLHKRGYRGIVGIDFLLTADDKLLVIETNPRITGVTPLLTALFDDNKGVPFYLIHLLELGNYPYTITDNTTIFDKTGALVILHSLEDHSIVLTKTPSSGTYRLNQETLERVSENIVLSKLNRGEFIIQDYMPTGVTIRPGGRMLTVQFREQILDENTDKLYNSTAKTIRVVQEQISYE